MVGRSPRASDSIAASAGSTSVDAPSSASVSATSSRARRRACWYGVRQRNVPAPRLTAGAIEVGAVLREQADERWPAAAADRVRDVRVLVRVGSRLEQQSDVVEPLVVECMGQGVRVARARAVLEEQLETGGASRLRRVVQGLAVVGVGACLQQHTGELGVVSDPGRAVERGHVAVLVLEGRVRVGATSRGASGRAQQTESTSGRRRGAAPRPAAHPARSHRRASGGRGRERPRGRRRAPAGRRAPPPHASAAARSPPARTTRLSAPQLAQRGERPLGERLERSPLPGGLRVPREAGERIGGVKLARDVRDSRGHETCLGAAPRACDGDERERERGALAQPLVGRRVGCGREGTPTTSSPGARVSSDRSSAVGVR